MRCKRIIIVSNTCMISSNDKVRTSKILSHNGMMNCLLRPSVPHLGMKGPKHSPTLGIIVFYKCFISSYNHFILEITRLFFANQWIYKQSIIHIHGSLLQHFMSNMWNVSCLKTNHSFPSSLLNF